MLLSIALCLMAFQIYAQDLGAIEVMLEEEEYQKVIDILSPYIEAGTEDPEIYYASGVAKASLELFRDAASDMHQAYLLDRNDYFAAFMTGYCLMEDADYAAAVAMFDKAEKLETEDPELYHYRGMALYLLGRIDGGCTDWEKAFSMGYAEAQTFINEFCQ